MKFIFLLTLVWLPGNILCLGFIRDLLFPRVPDLRRVKSVQQARQIGLEFAVLDFVGLTEACGYPSKEYDITTEDGYKLKIHRIPGSPNSPPENGKPVVLIQHGIFASSDSWVLMGAKRDLAFLLADRGYDVWIGNIRGNTYCRDHEDLSPEDPEFWQFSFDEMGLYDLPAMIDFALKESGEKSLYYIAHSMGTTMSFILLSIKPEYNEKIRLGVGLGPIAFWTTRPTIPGDKFITNNYDNLKNFLEVNHIHELLPLTSNTIRLGRVFCRQGIITQPVCVALMFLLSGEDPYQLDESRIPRILTYFPAGASTKTIYHFFQNINQSAFQPYDYGYTENFKIYGRKKPPKYDMKKISAPFALIYGPNDPLAKKSNVIELSKKLQNVVTVEPVPFDYFNHLDFLWARNARELVYERVAELLSYH